MNKKQEVSNATTQAEAGVVTKIGEKRPVVFREVYAIKEPYVYAAIVKEPETLKTLYEVIEPTLQEEEEKRLQ